MSRWTTPCSWAWSSASAAWSPRSGRRAEERPAAGRAARRGGRRAAASRRGVAAVAPGRARRAGRRGRRCWAGRRRGPRRPARTGPRPADGQDERRPPRPVGAAGLVQAVELPQLADHLGEGPALDELHGVVVHAALAARPRRPARCAGGAGRPPPGPRSGTAGAAAGPAPRRTAAPSAPPGGRSETCPAS